MTEHRIPKPIKFKKTSPIGEIVDMKWNRKTRTYTWTLSVTDPFWIERLTKPLVLGFSIIGKANRFQRPKAALTTKAKRRTHA